MQGLDALKAAVPGFVRRKGRNRARITALEAAYEEYRSRRTIFQMAEVAVPEALFSALLERIRCLAGAPT